MKKLFFMILVLFGMDIFACPTRLAHQLLDGEEICFKDVNTSLDVE